MTPSPRARRDPLTLARLKDRLRAPGWEARLAELAGKPARLTDRCPACGEMAKERSEPRGARSARLTCASCGRLLRNLPKFGSGAGRPDEPRHHATPAEGLATMPKLNPRETADSVIGAVTDMMENPGVVATAEVLSEVRALAGAVRRLSEQVEALKYMAEHQRLAGALATHGTKALKLIPGIENHQ